MKTQAARSSLLTLSIVVISSVLVCVSQCHTEANHGKKTLMLPVRDGTGLATDLYFPEERDGPWPAVLVRSPYGKESEKKRGQDLCSSGYVVAVQDVRGMFASDGEFELWVNEREDGYDAVEWLAAQDWCTGKVGMIGGSYAGWVQLAAAVERPPHLVTIIPKVTMADPFFNHVYPYGMFHLTQHLQALVIFENLGSTKGSGPGLVTDWRSQLDHLPIIDLDEKVLGGRNEPWRRHIEHNTRDSYWEKVSFLKELESLDIPVFIQGGWFDFGGIGTKLSYLHLKESKNKHIKLIIGPWSHRLEGTGRVGGHDFGEQAEVDLFDLSLRWFDFWLKGKENGIIDEPLVQVFATGQNRWLKANTYPLPNTSFVRFYLTCEEGASTISGDGRLRLNKASSGKEFDSYVYDPADPAPSLWFDAMGSYEALVGSREDVLVYQTEPLEESLMVAGPVSAKLYASSSAKDTDWVIYWRMVDDNSGVQYPMGRGTLRARYRKSPSNPELLNKDSIYEFTIDLWHMGMFLPKGCRIRVEVTSACFPDFSRNLNTGGNNEAETEYIEASQRIYHNEEYPSHLTLPIVNLDDYE